MNKKQIKDFEKLETMNDRAKFLLAIGVTAKTDIVNLDLVYRAKVGCIRLPVTASTENIAIKKGEKYLQERLTA